MLTSTRLTPVQLIIGKALSYIVEKDPSWEQAQPAEFKARIVESWKSKIQSEMISNSRVLWFLNLGDKTFGSHTPLFANLDWDYNPYQQDSQQLLLNIPRKRHDK